MSKGGLGLGLSLQLARSAVLGGGPSIDSVYLRPDGTSTYLQPDGTSQYVRPN